jgi:hypothetical protein
MFKKNLFWSKGNSVKKTKLYSHFSHVFTISGVFFIEKFLLKEKFAISRPILNSTQQQKPSFCFAGALEIYMAKYLKAFYSWHRDGCNKCAWAPAAEKTFRVRKRDKLSSDK